MTYNGQFSKMIAAVGLEGRSETFWLRTIVLASAALFYAWVLSRGSFNLFADERFGLVFNSMLSHMLRGGWDVDPDMIGYEAFFRDGRTYAYFGPFPAILRLPLLLLPHGLVPDWRALHVERLSCWVAIMIGIAAQASAMVTTLARAAVQVRRLLTLPLVLACAFSGAPMLLSWKGALIYHEAILWAWALAMLFVALALPAVSGPPNARRLCALALCAGLCLMTRSTTGAGLYLALGLLLLFRAVQTDGVTRSWRLPGWWFWAPATGLVVFIILTGVVNQGRWGNPLVFADLRAQTVMIDTFPGRMERLQRYGLFDWHRLGVGMLYYFFPVWSDQFEHLMPLKPRLPDLYDALELPASSLLLTDPAWCLLGVLGLVGAVRRRISASEAILAAGLSLAPVLMLSAWYLAFRYRAEFAPLLLVLSCAGLRQYGTGPDPGALRRKALLLAALCVVQLGSAATAGWSYALASFGPTSGYAALSLRCAGNPGPCIAGPAPAGDAAP